MRLVACPLYYIAAGNHISFFSCLDFTHCGIPDGRASVNFLMGEVGWVRAVFAQGWLRRQVKSESSFAFQLQTQQLLPPPAEQLGI